MIQVQIAPSKAPLSSCSLPSSLRDGRLLAMLLNEQVGGAIDVEVGDGHRFGP